MGHLLSCRDCSSFGVQDMEHLPGEAVLAFCPDCSSLWAQSKVTWWCGQQDGTSGINEKLRVWVWFFVCNWARVLGMSVLLNFLLDTEM